MPDPDNSPRRHFAWDVAHYGRFSDHRLRPALELLSRIDHPGPLRVHDVGCGTGDVTRLMTERWPEASVVGSDVSTEMLATASQIPSRVRWRHLDVRDWEADHREDVIYSNAVLHWVEDHQALFPRLIGFLAPGGVLAVQMPMSWDEPSHRGILEVLDQLDIGSAALRERYRRSSVAAPEWYIDLLRPLVTHLDVWATRYYQLLEGDDAVVRWVEGTALRPVIDELAPDDLDLFIPTYGRLMRDRYPPLDDGTTVYPFPRLFIVATR